MSRIQFAVVGSGWRAEFYLRICQNCPEHFQMPALVVRNAEKGLAVERRWGVRTFRTLDALLDAVSPAFVVTSVPWAANPGVLQQLAERRMPALSETPPAADLRSMQELYQSLNKLHARVQVAEQVHLRPHHAAQLALAASGRLGSISQAQLSVAHGYHGISLMRKFLKTFDQPARISASQFVSPIVKGAGREGPPAKAELKQSTQQFYKFDYGDRLGLIDFSDDQYFGWIRGERLLVRGELGEIVNSQITYLKDYRTPIRLKLERHSAGVDGDLQGNCLQGIQAGVEWVFKNPFAPAPMMDDEIAIAMCLLKMDEYLRTGREFYPLAEACQDHYLNLVAQQALASGEPLNSERQVWSS